MPLPIDILGLALLVCWNGLMYLSWAQWLLQTPWLRSEALLAAAIGWCCQVVATQLLLGLAGWLNPIPLFVLNLAIVLTLFALGQRQRFLARWSLVVPRWLYREDLANAFRELAASPAVICSAVVWAGWLVWTLWLVLIFPPYAADELYYHMPIVATLIQQGRIGPITSLIPWFAYPKNGELFAVWFSIFFHRDTFADIAMLPFGLIGQLALYVAARRLGATRPTAWLAACVLIFAPTVLIHLKTTYVDLLVVAMWTSGLAFLLPAPNANDERRTTNDGGTKIVMHKGGAQAAWATSTTSAPSLATTALLVGCTSGLILGTKYSGLPYVALVGLLLVARSLQDRKNHGVVQIVVLFSGCTCLFGGIWYLLNGVQFGNPLWPFELTVFGRPIFAGPLNAAAFTGSDSSFQLLGKFPLWQRLAYTWLDRSEVFSVDERLGGLGPLWAVVGLPSLALWSVLSIVRRRWYDLAVIAAHGILLLLTPLNWSPRYTLFLLALGGCSFAAISRLLRVWALHWVGALIVVLAVFSCINSVDFRYFSVPLIRMFSGLPDAERTGLTFAPGTFGATFRWIDKNVPAGGRIAFGRGVWRLYPLYGAHFEREVVSFPTTDFTAYVETLRAKHVRYAVTLPNQADTAALATSRLAKPVFSGDDGYVVYEIQP